MDIVKKKKNEATFKYLDNNVNLTLDEKGVISITVESPKGNNEVSKPGEYEYSGLNLTCLEVFDGEYKAKIDMLNIGLENNIDVMFLFKDIEISDYLKDKVKAINVLVTNMANLALLKNIIKTFQPEKVILFEDFNGQASSEDLEKLKSEFGKVEKIESSKIKFKESDFNTEEDTIQEFYIV